MKPLRRADADPCSVVAGTALQNQGSPPVGSSNAVGPDSPPTNLIKAMAEAVGKSVVAYVEVMYPEAIKATSSTFKTSLRNEIINKINHVATLHTEDEIRAWLKSNAEFNKRWLKQWRNIRRMKTPK